jgi:hypothetical protein
MKLVLGGWPDENATPAVLANFVKAISRIKEYEAKVQEAKADWIGQVNNLARPNKDIVINGTPVQAGTSYADFIASHVKYPGSDTASTPTATAASAGPQGGQGTASSVPPPKMVVGGGG